MVEKAEWGIIGAGGIGSEVMRQLNQDYVSDRLHMGPLPEFVVRSTGIMGPDAVTPLDFESFQDVPIPEVTFVAIPSSDDGFEAHEYISHILQNGGIAVTAEKGAISNYFSELKEESDNFNNLGINATVGGGTRLLEVAKHYCQDIDNITQIHLAVNGTLAAIMSSVGPREGSGMSLGQAVHQAVELGYAEPGSTNPNEVIRGEAESDIPKKTAIFFNALGLSDESLDWNELKFNLSDEDIDHAAEEAKVRRFIVSLYSPNYLEKSQKCPEDQIIGGFEFEHAGWKLVGGFRHIDRNPLFSALASTTGPSNGMVIGLGPNETDGVYSLVGPGAGVRQTANTMIDDYLSKR
ncbi:MAG: hypothetical protein NTV95_01930 [Candidatus Saccharibacteria bacterium]|nr:hypothetical protein [Candidatus Saccharibacteria bacterium]